MGHAGKAQPKDKIEYSISDLSRIYGVTLRALRFYEDKGLLKPTRRGTGRFYTASDRACLECILKGKRCGYSLYEIGLMLKKREAEDADGDASVRDLLTDIDPGQLAQQIRFLELRRKEISEAISELRAVAQLKFGALN